MLRHRLARQFAARSGPCRVWRWSWSVADGVEAVASVQRDPPDLIALDIHLPRLSGIETIQRIRAIRCCPILVVTAAVRDHIGRVYDAMSLGAVDAVDTPVFDAAGQLRGADCLIAKIATVSKLIGKPVPALCKSASAVTLRPQQAATLILLRRVHRRPRSIEANPRRFAARSFAVRGHRAACGPLFHRRPRILALAKLRRFRSSWPSKANRRRPARCCWRTPTTTSILDARRRLCYTPEPREACYRPSVDVFFSSVAEHWPSPGVAVLLTGMGRDGAKGLLQLHSCGWHTIAQDSQTCVVYGMPRAAAECGAAAEVLPLDRIGPAIVARVRKGR